MLQHRRFSVNSRLTDHGWRFAARRGGFSVVGAATVLAVLVATGGGIWWFVKHRDTSNRSSAGILLHTVARDDFELTVTERGEVEAFDVTEVRSLVKSNNTTGSAILRIVPEGTVVKKGDFLVELDSSSLKSQRTTQKILVNTAKAAEVEAHNTYDTAVIAKREYLEGTNLQERQLIESEVFVAEENLNRAKEYYTYSQKLASKGYVNELQLEADRFAVEKANKDLDTAKTKLHVLDEFTKPKMLSTLGECHSDRQGQMGLGAEQPRAGVGKTEGTRRPDRQVHDRGARRTAIVKYAHVMDGRGDQEFIVEEGAVVRERQVDHHACRMPNRCASI